jgi:hypothetical protein
VNYSKRRWVIRYRKVINSASKQNLAVGVCNTARSGTGAHRRSAVVSGRSLDDCTMDRNGEASQVWSL